MAKTKISKADRENPLRLVRMCWEPRAAQRVPPVLFRVTAIRRNPDIKDRPRERCTDYYTDIKEARKQVLWLRNVGATCITVGRYYLSNSF